MNCKNITACAKLYNRFKGHIVCRFSRSRWASFGISGRSKVLQHTVGTNRGLTGFCERITGGKHDGKCFRVSHTLIQCRLLPVRARGRSVIQKVFVHFSPVVQAAAEGWDQEEVIWVSATAPCCLRFNPS